MVKETLEQAGSRNLQALLINPNDGLALHHMIRSFMAAVKENPESALSISALLDRAGRSLCAAAIQSQALITAQGDPQKLRFGMESLRRINGVYTQGYSGIEDVGYWKHNILHPEKQLDMVLGVYISLLRKDPAALHDCSQPLVGQFKNIWRVQHLDHLRTIHEILRTGGPEVQGKANLLLSEVLDLKRALS